MAGRIPEDVVEQVRDRNDIVAVIDGYVPLKRRGTDYWACCPFHKEKSPSFKVSPNHQTYYCFGCKKSGNVFHFIMEHENVDFLGAVHLLAQRAGVFIPEEPMPTSAAPAAQAARQAGVTKERIFEVLEAITKWYQQQLRETAAAPAREYLNNRGIDATTINQFRLGYAPDSWDAVIRWGERQSYSTALLIAAGLVIQKEDENQRVYDRFRGRLLFPICDELGRVVGFSARTLEKDASGAKYINTPETSVFHKSKILYGLHLARNSLREAGGALICEGQLDVIACHRAGITHAVAPQGTAFTETQARILKRYSEEITFAYDADEAGQKAAVRSIDVAITAELRPQVVLLPAGEDPDSLYRTRGPEELKAIMGQAQPAFEFMFNQLAALNDPQTPEGKQHIVQQILEIIANITQPVMRAAQCQWLSARLQVPEAAIFHNLNSIMHTRQRSERRAAARDSATTSVQADAAAGAGGITAMSFQTQPNQQAVLGLLDLAIHHGPIAHRLTENQTLIPGGPFGNSAAASALLLVLRKTAEGNWKNAAAAIGAEDRLVSNPDVAAVLHQSKYPAITPKMDDRERERTEKLLNKAVDECLFIIAKNDLEKEIQDLNQQLASESDDDKLRLIMTRLQELAQQRKHLQPLSR